MLLTAIAVMLCAAQPARCQILTAKVTGGELSGVVKDGIASFKGIPFAEAASFFLGVRGFGKQATVGDLEAALSELSPEERAEVLKEANAMPPPAAPSLPATAKGMNMPQVAPQTLPPAAMGTRIHAA